MGSTPGVEKTETMSEIEIKPFTPDAYKGVLQHLERHRRESGLGGIHFMPFAPGDPDARTNMSIEKAQLPLGTPGWQRWFYAAGGGASFGEKLRRLFRRGLR